MEFHHWLVRLRNGQVLEGDDDFPKLDLFPLVHTIELTLPGLPDTFILENIPEGCVPYLKCRHYIDMCESIEIGRGRHYIIGDGTGREWHITLDGGVEEHLANP